MWARGLAAVSIVWLLSAGTTRADSTVLVLGLRSVEGDDAIALKLSTALRKKARGVSAWHLREQAVTLTQMSLAHGCDEVDAVCLADIAKALSTDMLVFGSVRRASASADSGWTARIEVFDQRKGAITAEASAPISAAAQHSDLGSVAKSLLTQLLPAPMVPSLVVRTNVPGAELRLNGQLMGQFQSSEFVVKNLQAGRYLLLVSALGYQSYERAVLLEGGKPVALEAILQPSQLLAANALDRATPTGGSSGGVPGWLPITLFAVSGVSLAATAGSWLGIRGVEDDPLFQAYGEATFADASERVEAGAQINLDDIDVCAEAKDGLRPTSSNDNVRTFTEGDVDKVSSLCKRGDTLEVLQFVFLGLAGVTATAGLVLLLVDGGEEDSAATDGPSRARLMLKPELGMRRAGVTAVVQF